jgi:diguanylate cyclase (GGDEF)-like protein/PAS domain S-box-containing protein
MNTRLIADPATPGSSWKTEMRFSRHAWWLYLALTLPISVAYLAGPLHAGPVYNAIGFSGTIAMIVGVRMHRPAARWAWYVLAIAQVLFVGGDVVAYNYTAIFGGALPAISLADVFYLSCYPVTAAGLLLLIRSRNPGRDWASLIDSAIVTIGLALLSWIVLISPLAHNGALPLGTKLVSIAYPLADILVLGVAVRLAVGTGWRSLAYYMIVGALIVVLAADSAYGWSLLHGVYNLGTPLDAGWIAAHLLFGAAALHPSMTTVSQQAAAKLRLTPVRFVAIAAAALIAPVIMVVEASARAGSDEIVVGCAAIVLFTLVVVRMIGLARDQQAATARERTMRQAADAFVTATSPTEIVLAAQDAAGVLAGAAAQPTVLRIVERDGARCLVGADPRGGDGELQLPLTLLPEGVVDQLERRVAVDLCMVDLRGAEAVMLGPSLATPVFVVPILAQGRLAGAVALLDATAASAPTRNSLETLAGQVGLALESAALTETLVRTQSEARLSALVQHSTDVILVITPDTTVEYASPSIRQILGYEDGDFVGQRLLDYVGDEDQALFQPALAVLLSLASETSEGFEFRIRHRDGRLLYTECLITNLLNNAAVGGIVVNLRDITERKQFEAQLTYQAFHDPVTDLANRALFRDRVEHALSRRRDHSRALAVLFLDLDDFKAINDTFGHLAGDRLLQTISSRLRSTLRVGDTVARLGGDEFAVLLEEIVDETAVSEIVEGLLEAIRAPLLLDEHEVSVQCSIGIAVARSNSAVEVATTVEEVLRNADVAMYQAKAADGDTYRYFKLEMHDAVVKQLALRADLKAAIAADELTLAYQPIFDVASGEISGSEALLRWEHDVRGTVSPATFIPVAEDSGLIIPLGRWVLERACHDAVDFQHAAPAAEHHAVSVNISARQLHRVEIVEEVHDALRSSGLDPSCLVLEITESLLIDDIELAIERLSALRTLGIRIAVDDFGTGYSSLNYIRRLPIDFLKIDKDFIDSVDADDMEGKLTAAMIGLARVLDLGCVAEGVERTAQQERLKELGCDYAQGFLLARPMTADALRELLGATAPALVTAS